MFLNAVRFRTYGDAKAKVWRFTQGTGNLTNFICFYDNAQTVKDLKSALRYAIAGDAFPRILECAVQITDDSGDTWIIDRTPDRTRIVKNGKAIENAGLGETLLSSLLDLDLDAKNTSKSDQAFNLYNLHLEDSELTSTLESDHTQPLRKLKAGILESKKKLTDQIIKLLDQPLLQDETLINNLQQKAEPLFNAYREILRQRRSLLANTQSITSIDDKMISQLEYEVDLIQQIEKTAQPLLDPASAPKILKEKIEKLEVEVREQLRDTNFPEETLPLDEIPWDKLVSCLSKLEAFERLVQASEKAQLICSDRIENIQDDYIKTLETLLSSDTQITAELESCLSTLSLQAITKKTEKTSVGDVIMKFIKPSADVPIEEAESEKHLRLETARMAVDFALGRLGELHANLAEARNSFDHLQISLREHHETIVHEFGKLKNLWQRLSKEYRIPTDTSLAELLRLCVRYVKINELHRLRQHYKQNLSERKTLLQKLTEQIIAWRQVSESQKNGPLDNPSILIGEAQGIIRYRSSKLQQLDKLKALHTQMGAYQAISTTINARETQIKAAWKKCFIELEIPEISADKAGWPEALCLIHQLQAWSALLNVGSAPLAGAEIFSESASDKIFTIYTCSENGTKPSFNLQVAKSLDRASIRGFVFIATTDKELSETLTKSGTGSARMLVQKQNQSAPAVKSKVPERNEKIQSTLDTLNPRRYMNIDKNS